MLPAVGTTQQGSVVWIPKDGINRINCADFSISFADLRFPFAEIHAQTRPDKLLETCQVLHASIYLVVCKILPWEVAVVKYVIYLWKINYKRIYIQSFTVKIRNDIYRHIVNIWAMPIYWCYQQAEKKNFSTTTYNPIERKREKTTLRTSFVDRYSAKLKHR